MRGGRPRLMSFRHGDEKLFGNVVREKTVDWNIV